MRIISNNNLSTEALKIKNSNDNILTDINDITNATMNLTNYWTGEDASSFINKLNDEIIPKLNKSYDKLDDYVEFMKKVNSVFEAVDENYGKKIDV